MGLESAYDDLVIVVSGKMHTEILKWIIMVCVYDSFEMFVHDDLFPSRRDEGKFLSATYFSCGTLGFEFVLP